MNPSVGGGSVDMLSTADRNSKFGLLMVGDCEKKILDLYNEFSFLQGEKFANRGEGINQGRLRRVLVVMKIQVCIVMLEVMVWI